MNLKMTLTNPLAARSHPSPSLPLLTLLLLVLISHHALIASAVGFYVDRQETKCFSETLDAGELWVGEFAISPPARTDQGERGVHTLVSDPKDKTLYDKRVDNGKFAFTTERHGEYVFCFTGDSVKREVRFSSHSGVKARDYSQVATQEHLKPLEVQMRRMRDQANSLLSRYRRIRKIEDEMYHANGFCFFFVFCFLVLDFFVCVCVFFCRVVEFVGDAVGCAVDGAVDWVECLPDVAIEEFFQEKEDDLIFKYFFKNIRECIFKSFER